MNIQSIEKSINSYLKNLNIDEQKKILEFARTLSSSKLIGSRGKDLISFASTIEKNDLDLMQKAIETGCEKVNEDEW